MMKIPFNKIYLTGDELKYIQECFLRGEISGDGYFTKLVSSLMENKFSVKHVQMTTSATHALEIATRLLAIEPGDEVIMPSFTFPSTANAVMLLGGKPVFAEINRENLNIDPEDIKNKITNKTKAILPVHYGGIGCEMDKIMAIAKDHGLYVIEDAAQGVNAKYKDKFLGTWGDLGCYSFHGTKNYISGEGGAIAFNLDDDELVKNAKIISQKGTNRNQFIKGEVDKYSWVSIGSSYVPSEILMAILYPQLKELDLIKEKRKKINDFYYNNLSKYIGLGKIKGMTTIPEDRDSNYHLFYILLDNERTRNNVIKRLKDFGVLAYSHFVPLHTSTMGRLLGYYSEDLPITQEIGKTLLRLPMYTHMTYEEMDYVVKSLDTIIKEL